MPRVTHMTSCVCTFQNTCLIERFSMRQGISFNPIGSPQRPRSQETQDRPDTASAGSSQTVPAQPAAGPSTSLQQDDLLNMPAFRHLFEDTEDELPLSLAHDLGNPLTQDWIEMLKASQEPAQASQTSGLHVPASAPAPVAAASAPVVMSRTQFQLLRQFEAEAGPSAPLQQEDIDFAAQLEADLSSPLRQESLQEVLAAFRHRADANRENTSVTKDYCCDVLGEIADWLTQQTYHPQIHSLSDLQRLWNSGNANNRQQINEQIRMLMHEFHASCAAPILGGEVRWKNIDDASHSLSIVMALLRSDRSFLLLQSSISRQAERLIYAYRTLPEVLNPSGRGVLSERAMQRNVTWLTRLSHWLDEKKARGESVLYGLDSLEKIRNHGQDREIGMMLEDGYFKAFDFNVQDKGKSRAAVLSFWQTMRSAFAPAASGLSMQPGGQRRQASLMQADSRMVRPRLEGDSSSRSATQISFAVPRRALPPLQQQLLDQYGQGASSTQPAAPLAPEQDEEQR